jgi:uncharacterized metal-binding protein
MGTEQTSCGCACSRGSKGPRLIFSCSGAADVGELADRAARKLNRDGLGKMFCLAGIGGQVSGIVKTTEAATSILAIDGCALECAKQSLEVAGIKQFSHIKLSDHGFEKGKTTVNVKAIETVTDLAGRYLY